LPDVDDAQLVAFQVDHVAVEGTGHDRVLGNLPWEDRVPELHHIRGELPPCVGNDGRRGEGPGVGEGVEDRIQAKEMIAVPVGDVDRREVLSGGADPVDDPPRVLGSEDGVDEDCVTVAADQGDRGCRPGRLALTHRGNQSDDRLVGDDEYVQVQRTGHGRSFQSDLEVAG